jgi:hypothetical protein
MRFKNTRFLPARKRAGKCLYCNVNTPIFYIKTPNNVCCLSCLLRLFDEDEQAEKDDEEFIARYFKRKVRT